MCACAHKPPGGLLHPRMLRKRGEHFMLRSRIDRNIYSSANSLARVNLMNGVSRWRGLIQSRRNFVGFRGAQHIPCGERYEGSYTSCK